MVRFHTKKGQTEIGNTGETDTTLSIFITVHVLFGLEHKEGMPIFFGLSLYEMIERGLYGYLCSLNLNTIGGIPVTTI